MTNSRIRRYLAGAALAAGLVIVPAAAATAAEPAPSNTFGTHDSTAKASPKLALACANGKH